MQIKASQQSDATFVTTADVSESAPLSPRGAHVIPDQQFNMLNETFDVTKASKPSTSSKSEKTKTKSQPQANDIMTDDESDSESLYQKKLKSQQKNTKELFKWVNTLWTPKDFTKN